MILLRFAFGFLILLSSQSRLVSTSGIGSSPIISFTVVGAEWKNFTTASNKLILHSLRGDDLSISCKANYPIQWKIDGLINPPEIVKVQPPTRDFHQNLFEIGLIIFFLEAENYAGLAASSTIACVSLRDLQSRDEFSVFVRGSNPLPRPVISYVTDSFLIPCYTTDPREPVTLNQRTTTETETQVDNVKYEPTTGFVSNTLFDGNYVCRQGTTSGVLVVANTTKLLRGLTGYEANPKAEIVQAFSEDSIELKCSSTVDPINLVIRKSEMIKLLWLENTETNKTIKLSFKSREIISPDSPSNFSVAGNVACVTKNNKLIKEWIFEFIETPELYLDNFEGEVDCLAEYKPKIVQTVRCKNRMECDFMKHCLRNASSCNFKKQKQFFGNKETDCWIEKLETGKACVSVPYSHLNGLAQCTVGGLSKTWEFFVSLGFLRYSNWKDAPIRELLQMDEVPDVLYTNGTTQFFCMGVAYLFADSLSFDMEYANGSRVLLQDDGVLVNVSHPSSENPRKIDEFNVIGILDIVLPIDAVAIHCIAPWWNSTDTGLETSRKFKTRHLLTPTLVDDQDKVEEHFYLGEKNCRLTCHARGEPQPIYQWTFNGENATNVFPDIKMSLGSNGEGYLEFPQVEGKFAGVYTCIASNKVGKVEKQFSLGVSDEPISGKNVVYIVTVTAVLLVLAFVLCAFAILIRRYRAAQELVRSLTDSEIDDFFHGKPELLSNVGPNSMEIIDFLPYKNDYEIMMDDIEFDSSEKNWLGQGEFSYVVRGKIVSKNKPVAIKISKPSADVTLFKSLLSEVKIMIYIGEHEHVITLVGVCTEGIRNRCIHIATEICDFGSLDTFLRKGRPNFVDLINSNQEIDTTILPNEGSHLSTLDLISFSAQIAKGMEYLAFKSVIHADLAARNVLVAADKTAKISDFGLSKKLYESNNYMKRSKSPLPWRWMSLEALTTLTFSTKSDVWSYGATLFEIFTLGDIPFPNEEWNKEFLSRLSSGMRMGRPKYSTQEIYSKIVACWENEPDLRPNFTTLRFFFTKLLKQFPEEALAKANIPVTGIDPAPGVTESLYVNCDDSYDIPVNYSQVGVVQGGSNSPMPNYINLE